MTSRQSGQTRLRRLGAMIWSGMSSDRFAVLLVSAIVAATIAGQGSVVAAEQEATLPEGWIDLRSRSLALEQLIEAAARVAGSDSFWVGYGFPLRSRVLIGCDWHGRGSVSVWHDDLIIIHGNDGQEDDCRGPFGLFFEVVDSTSRNVRRVRLTSWRRARRLGEPVIWAGHFGADVSLQFLRPHILGSRLRDGSLSVDARKELLTAAAVHDSPRSVELADAALAPQQPSELRESAVFWVATFGGSDWVLRILDIARRDDSREVRKDAVFWLGQMAGQAATEALADMAVSDPDTEVRKTAVFALSQSEDGAAIDALIRIARTHRNPEVVKSALFWLGQSGDPRALELFEEILLGKSLRGLAPR